MGGGTGGRRRERLPGWAVPRGGDWRWPLTPREGPGQITAPFLTPTLPTRCHRRGRRGTVGRFSRDAATTPGRTDERGRPRVSAPRRSQPRGPATSSSAPPVGRGGWHESGGTLLYQQGWLSSKETSASLRRSERQLTESGPGGNNSNLFVRLLGRPSLPRGWVWNYRIARTKPVDHGVPDVPCRMYIHSPCLGCSCGLHRADLPKK